MPPMLREPWFLRGRKSVLLRAVLMSFVLAALACFAGFTLCLSVYAIFGTQILSRFTEEQFFLTKAGITGLTIATLAGIPCSYWYGHSQIRVGVSWLLVGLASSQSIHLDSIVNDWMRSAGCFNLWSASPHEVALFLCLWIVWSFCFLRRARTYVLSVALSALVLPVVSLVMPEFEESFTTTPWDLLSYSTNGILPQLDLRRIPTIKATGTLLTIFIVPWGIPFWFPPAAQPAETAG